MFYDQFIASHTHTLTHSLLFQVIRDELAVRLANAEHGLIRDLTQAVVDQLMEPFNIDVFLRRHEPLVEVSLRAVPILFDA